MNVDNQEFRVEPLSSKSVKYRKKAFYDEIDEASPSAATVKTALAGQHLNFTELTLSSSVATIVTVADSIGGNLFSVQLAAGVPYTKVYPDWRPLKLQAGSDLDITSSTAGNVNGGMEGFKSNK